MDALRLTIESHAADDLETPLTFDVVGAPAKIGRKPGNDWILPDPTRHISGHHFDILFKDGQYLLHDRSTNGTFLNGQKDRVVSPYRIADGDRFKVGPYTLLAALQPVSNIPTKAPTRPPAVVPPAGAGGGKRNVQAPPSAAMMGEGSMPQRVSAPGTGSSTASRAQTPDFARFQATAGTAASKLQKPGGPSPANPQPEPADPVAGIMGAATPELPDDLDLGLPPEAGIDTDPAPAANTGPFGSDDATPFTDLKPDTASAPPQMQIPDDDFDLTPSPAPLDAAPDLVPNTPEPKVTPTVEVSDKLESQPPRGLGESFADPTPLPSPFSDNFNPTPDAVPAPASPPAPAAAPPVAAAPPPAPAPTSNPFLEGFLKGAEIDSADSIDMPLEELGEILGRCVRTCTREIMQMLQDRSNVKLFVTQEDRTMRIADGNNPMKFMPDAEQAFETLFVQPRSGYQTGAAGFENALTDIRKHQAAMMAAVQPALSDVMAGLDPAGIEADTGKGGGMLKGGNKKQWEEFVTRWNARAGTGDNGMVDAFVKAYAKHYTDALTKL